MNRCLNVLREAAGQMFQGKSHKVLDIEYYNNEEEKGDNSDDDENLIFLNKGKKKLNRAKDIIHIDDDEL